MCQFFFIFFSPRRTKFSFSSVCSALCKRREKQHTFILQTHTHTHTHTQNVFITHAFCGTMTTSLTTSSITTTTTTRLLYSYSPSPSGLKGSAKRRVSSSSRKIIVRRKQVIPSSSSSSSSSSAAAAATTKTTQRTELRGKETRARKLSVPYKDGNKDCDVLVNDEAKEKIIARNCSKYVSLIDGENPKLKILLNVIEKDWDRIGVKNKNAGHHTLWPEAFEAGKALLEECFPEECSPEFGGEVLNGVGFVNEPEFQKTRAIDFMQRRPKGDFTHCKYNPLPRLHRDPDAIDYKSPNWMETAMENSEEYSYRYYNVWISRTPKDPTGQVWDNPLLVLLPKDGGSKEWKYDIRTEKDNLDENGNEIKPPSAFEQIKSNPMAAAPIVMNMFSTKKGKDFGDATDPNYLARGSPELIADDEHEWVTGPFVAFDSFDCWHGSGKWDSDAKKSLIEGSKNPMEARSEAAKGRISMELRFRARCKPNSREGLAWSPVSAAYRSNKFTEDSVRPSEQTYDLVSGKAL